MKKYADASMCTAWSTWLLMLVATPSATAAVAFKCMNRDGAVSFQDRPCAANEQAERLQLPDDPLRPAAGDFEPAAIAEEAPAKPTVRLDTPSPRSPRSGFMCTRDDGTRYLSDTGIPQRRAVPLSMLGVPSRGLADAYGPGGAGISAPGVRAASSTRSTQGAIGAAYVWVEDRCSRASGEQVCAFLAGQIDAAERKLRYAFSDTTAQVKADIVALRSRAIDCAL